MSDFMERARAEAERRCATVRELDRIDKELGND